jgi:hypothetical protein
MLWLNLSLIALIVSVADEGTTMDHVRAAQARGLPWRRVALRYIIRPTTPTRWWPPGSVRSDS